MALWLNEDEIVACLSMEDAIAALREAFADPKAQVLPRWRGRGERAQYSVMAAALPGLGICGLKQYMGGAGRTRFVVLVHDMNTGELLGLLEADHLGRIRTGAASGLATDLLARPDAEVFGCIGAGGQAATQVAAVLAVRPGIREVRVYSRTPERAQAFAARIGERARAVASAEEAVRGADIVTTITNARAPVLEGRWLGEGCHVNGAGSNVDGHAELDAEAVRRCSAIFADNVPGARTECGDLIQAGVDWSQVHELGDLVAGRVPGRRARGDITLFESQGIALEDVAAGAAALKVARARGIGREVPFGEGRDGAPMPAQSRG
ncbi:MAG TPA: ornithine cyclodeaminase family protein [Bacillota bacterium]|nr:ornithine cyclodeaminase family protein [Bacillota bacterium]